VTVRHGNPNGIGLSMGSATVERVHSRTVGDWGCRLAAGAVIRDSVCATTTNDTFDGAGLIVQHFAAGSASVVLRNVTAVATQPDVVGLKAMPFNASAVLTVFATNLIAQGGSTPDVVTTLTQGEADIVLDHSNYDSVSEGGPEDQITDPGTGNNQTAAPVFKDAANGDFRQLATSTGTVDRGTAATVNGVALGTADVDGDPRSVGTAPDIGADEGVPPDPPVFFGSDPDDPGDSLEPKLQGSVSNEADEVWIYDNAGCTGAPVAEGTPAQFNFAGIPVSVEPGSDNIFWAVAIKEVFPSACSSTLASGGSIAYDVIPTPPAINSSDPASGANDNTPKLIGTAREDANTVLIFTGAGCSGAQVAEGPASDFTSTGIEVGVADNTTTTFYARAVGDNGTSGCSATGFSYTEATPAVNPPPTPSAGPTGQRAKALKKCAKIKKKAKKKKCKARARKLPV
jgi:hypothetical protein